jgi:hypothetical protein
MSERLRRPFRYLAEPTLKRIAQEFADAVQVTWRAFELRPVPGSCVPGAPPRRADWLRAR